MTKLHKPFVFDEDGHRRRAQDAALLAIGLAIIAFITLVALIVSAKAEAPATASCLSRAEITTLTGKIDGLVQHLTERRRLAIVSGGDDPDALRQVIQLIKIEGRLFSAWGCK
jgi:hypothetical protein